MKLLSVNVGKPKNVAWQGETVFTGVWKAPVDGPVMARRLNLDGDGQGDTAGHGGEMRAVMVYQIQSHRYWADFLGRDDLGYGVFGENLTVDGMGDDEVCIGDRYRIGEAEFEVTQPRVTCYRVGMRLGEPRMPALLVSHHRPGFYMRVLTEGRIRAGDDIVKTRTGPGALSVADTDAALYLPHPDEATVRRALEIPALSPGWQQSFRELIDGTAGAGGIATAAKPAWSGFRKVRVTRIVPESTNVSSIYLSAADGSRLPAARGGQYVTLRIPGDAVRSYSLSSAPGTDDYRISVKHLPDGPVSTYLTGTLRQGDVLDAGAPRGDFVLTDESRPILLLSAGIGVTPVLSMLHELADQHSKREVWWIHGDRGPGQPPLTAEATALIKRLPNARAKLFVSPEHVTEAALTALRIPLDACAYLCGPDSFMDDVRAALTTIGLDAGRIHTELFGALAAINPGVTAHATRPPHQPPGPAGTGPLVTFARSNLSARFPRDDAGQPHLLDFAESCDVPTRWSCRTGVCQTCITPLLSGDIAYDPEPLDEPTDGRVLICCARPRTDVVLDM
ncbi:MOSC and FAD-binding oxidoreductase domain-containing protein [Actinoplanes sp. TBRC 11911]|uniref:MOSC and FAD-binding oxidoreductase domain-containing protein n=1 Tax=Actinoplanes sp. TBRC 11911 TaxID=2729386 RepID=UPI002898C6C9|nr:MOSC and FAD-binding oxidoreductase domain-containing protein [Actinoplanes sp. TBRC 11911]